MLLSSYHTRPTVPQSGGQVSSRTLFSWRKFQRRATKYILNHTSATYKDRLKSLKLLPLMYQFKLNDILLYISYLKDSNSNLPILNELSFSSAQTRSSTFSKLPHKPVNSSVHSISFVSRFPRLWNALPVINISSPLPSIKQKLITHFGPILIPTLTPQHPELFITVAPVVAAHLNPDSIITPYNHAFNHFFSLVLVPSRSYWVAFSSNLSLYFSILFLLLSYYSLLTVKSYYELRLYIIIKTIALHWLFSFILLDLFLFFK